MSRNFLFFFILFISFTRLSVAQENIIEGATPDLHLKHKVVSKETWYSIGRSYNLNPKELATYNRLSINKPLEIGTTLNVPLTAANFSQNLQKSPGEVLVPLYHIVKEKEWLYRISVNHNKVPVANIEKWNSITKDDARAGMKLIVGYLKVNDGNASIAHNTPAPEKPVPAKPELPAGKEVAKTGFEKTTEPATATEVKQVSNQKAGGYFRNLYENDGKNASGVTGIFKSTSGWNDGKYYALMNNVPVGTIVEVTYPQTNRSVFAKVLGELPEMKESAGLSLRISDAAASELGASESKFSVDVKY